MSIPRGPYTSLAVLARQKKEVSLAQVGLVFDEARHEYRYNGEVVLSVTQVLKLAGLTGEYRGDVAEIARLLGTSIHALTEASDRGEPLWDYPTDLDGYIRAYRKFLQDSRFRPTHIEHRVFHVALRYAGTLDRFGVLPDGREVLLDIKTSKMPSKWWGAQLAAYTLALFPDRAHWPIRCALQLMPTGQYAVHTYAHDAIDRDTFLSALAQAHTVAADSL